MLLDGNGNRGWWMVPGSMSMAVGGVESTRSCEMFEEEWSGAVFCRRVGILSVWGDFKEALCCAAVGTHKAGAQRVRKYIQVRSYESGLEGGSATR